jgi:hypothetical protein
MYSYYRIVQACQQSGMFTKTMTHEDIEIAYRKTLASILPLQHSERKGSVMSHVPFSLPMSPITLKEIATLVVVGSHLPVGNSALPRSLLQHVEYRRKWWNRIWFDDAITVESLQQYDLYKAILDGIYSLQRP